MIHPVLFTTLSTVILAGALGVLIARNPVYSVLSLVVTLLGLSALFVGLGAYFVAIIQILVYAGAVLVLFLFVVMLLDTAPEALSRTPGRILKFTGTVVGLLFLLQLAFLLPNVLQQALPSAAHPPLGTTAEVGKHLFTTYALPFELASALLVVGIIGAIALAKRRLL